ncbi:unnamed protein product [Prunus armeniaca]
MKKQQQTLTTLLIDNPIYFEDAMKNEKWRKAMDSEIEAIKKNNTWELMELLAGKSNWSKVGV